MSQAEQLEEQELKPTKVPYLRTLTGGKGPPEGPEEPSEDWLSNLEERTVFACRANKNTVDWEIYFLVHKQDGIFFLKMETPDGKVWDRRVDPKVFCKHYRVYNVIAVHPTIETEAPEGDDDGSDRERDPD